jgi:SAM-dependent methyltransferase
MQSFEGYYMKDKAEYEMTRKWIEPNTRLLDVGCGCGWFGREFSRVRYTGLEYSESAAEEARAAGLDVQTRSVQEHPYTHKSAYQVVCAFQVLEHVPDTASFISACIDCLEPDGLLIYAVPSNDSYLQFRQNAATNLPPHHLTRWPDKTLEAIPKFFSVSLMALEHEVVSDIHLQTCVQTIIKRKLDTLFGRTEAIVHHSLGARILNRCAHVFANWSPAIFDDVVLRPRGHTVIAAYKKNRPTGFNLSRADE